MLNNAKQLTVLKVPNPDLARHQRTVAELNMPCIWTGFLARLDVIFPFSITTHEDMNTL